MAKAAVIFNIIYGTAEAVPLSKTLETDPLHKLSSNLTALEATRAILLIGDGLRLQ